MSSCGASLTNSQHQNRLPHLPNQHRLPHHKTANPSLGQGHHNGCTVGGDSRRAPDTRIHNKPGIITQLASRGSHGSEASGGVIGYYHEGRPMDIPHVHDIHPGPNRGTRQRPGMENVKKSYLSQREVNNKTNWGEQAHRSRHCQH